MHIYRRCILCHVADLTLDTPKIGCQKLRAVVMKLLQLFCRLMRHIVKSDWLPMSRDLHST